MKPLDEVLTSDLFHYFVGQAPMWILVLAAAIVLMPKLKTWKLRLLTGCSLLAMCVSSLMPLLIRQAAGDPGLGGPDAAAEETLLSFFGTLPPTIGFVLLAWVFVQATRGPTKDVSVAHEDSASVLSPAVSPASA